MSDTTTLLDLKKKIIQLNSQQTKKNTWFHEKSSLMFAGQVLDRDQNTLKQYGIGPNSVVTFAHWYKFNVPISKYKLKIFQHAFSNYDVDGSGEIDSSELFILVNELGMRRSREQCDQMVAKIDADGSGEIDFEEFCTLMVKCMRIDHDGALFDALHGAGKLSEREQRNKDSGANIMWEPNYPGENDTRVNPEERYGQVIFVKEEDEEKGRYIFQDDYEEYLQTLPETVETKEGNDSNVDYGVVYQSETNSYVFKSSVVVRKSGTTSSSSP